MKLDKALGLLLLLALVVRVPFLFIVPMVEAPDEFAHFWVTKFLSENFCAPNAEQVIAGGPSAAYGSLPPFGYLPHALFSRLIPVVDISFSERAGSILGGLVTVFAAFKIGAMLFARNSFQWLQVILPLTVAIHPQFVFVNAYCNSDSTACALASLLLLVALTAIFRGPSLRYAASAGVICADIALSKYSALAVVPVFFFAIAAACWIYRITLLETAMTIGLTFAVALILTLPWFARSASVFGGDWSGTRTMKESWAKTFNRSIESQNLISVLKQKVWWQQLFCSFWGVYGYQKHYLPAVFYIGYLLSIAISVAGTFTMVSQALKHTTLPIVFFRRPEDGQEDLVKEQAAWLSLCLSVLLSGAGLLYAAVQNLGGPQGRYLFPSEIAFMALILFGLAAVGSKWGKWLVFAFTIGNAIALLFSIVMLFSMFGVKLKPY